MGRGCSDIQTLCGPGAVLRRNEQGGHEDLDYLKQTLRLLLRYQKDEDIQNLANTYLPEEPDLTEINQTLAFGAAHANHLRGNYDRADDYLMTYNLIDSPDGIILSARISWDRGDKIAAITKMKNPSPGFPSPKPFLSSSVATTENSAKSTRHDAMRFYAM